MHVSLVSKSLVAATVLVAGLCAAASASNVKASGEDEVTLVVWDGETGDAPNEMLDQLNAEFEASHPDVTIERVTKAFEDLTVTVPLAMTIPIRQTSCR